MNVEGVVIFEAKSGIPLFSKLRNGMDESLFSSFVTAVRHFSSELALGGLCSFATDEKVIFLSQNEQTVTALITTKTPEFEETLELADEIGQQFEEKYQIPTRPQPLQFAEFRSFVDDMLKRVQNPFLNRVARFAHKEYGGSISLKTRLLKRSGASGIIDVLVNHPQKSSDDDGRSGLDELAMKAFSQNFTFVKAIDDIATRGAVIDFIDSVDSYGVRYMNKDKLEFRPYFPSRAVIVARDYAEDVRDFIEKLPTENGIPYIDGSHLYAGPRIGSPSADTRCQVDLWRWRDNGHPDKFLQ
ncbi:hypothetical protein EU546_02225 [Candidatus Thorarchaeota archaeon]|nr:MAG: hypothetical protein EU546_02225 [Candidatus Thorarchaeota archaeon]